MHVLHACACQTCRRVSRKKQPASPTRRRGDGGAAARPHRRRPTSASCCCALHAPAARHTRSPAPTGRAPKERRGTEEAERARAAPLTISPGGKPRSELHCAPTTVLDHSTATSRERHARAPLQRYGGQGAPGDAAARLPRKTCMRHVPHMHPHAHSATTIRTVLLVSPHAEPGPCRMRTRACVQQAKCGKARLHSRMRYCSAQGSGHTAAPPRPGSGCGRH